MGLAPTFKKPINIESASEDNQTVITCQVTGIPKPNVIWKTGSTTIVSNESIQTYYDETTGEVSLTLLDAPKSEQTAVYTIEVENEFGRAVSKAEIVRVADEHAKPIIKKLKAPHVTPLKAQTIKTKSTLTLKSSFIGIPLPEVKWYKNGKEIVPDDDTVITITDGTTSLTIQNMDRKRAGKYEIVAINEVGESRASGSIMVTDADSVDELKPPYFTEPIKPKTALLNEIIILDGLVESYPDSSFQWFFNSMPIKQIENIRIHSQNNKTTLIIDNLTSEYDGVYTCRAENVAGSVTSSASVKLVESEAQCEEVKEYLSPRFVQKLKPLQIMDGEPLKLACRVVGNPIPKIVWLHNKHALTEDKGTNVIQDSNGNCELHITEVFVEDGGVYACKATNKFGKATTKANIVIEGILFKSVFSVLFHCVCANNKNSIRIDFVYHVHFQYCIARISSFFLV